MAPTQPRNNPPRRRGRGRSSGQALVEFALIAPIFFVVFFGIVEFSFILTTLSGFNFAAREGARYGSIIGNSDPNADQGILSAIITRSQVLPFGTPISVDIYKANQDGSCVSSTGTGSGALGTPSCTEDFYTFSSKTSYTASFTGWSPTSRNDTLIGADYLGVHVLFQYTFVTSFLNYYCNPPSSCPTGYAGTHLNLSATSVQRIEPQDFGSDVPSRAPITGAVPPWLTVVEWFTPALVWREGAMA